MNNKYILFYSDKCQHSKEFIIELHKLQYKYTTLNSPLNCSTFSLDYITFL